MANGKGFGVKEMNTLIVKLPSPIREHSERSALIASFLVEKLKGYIWFSQLGIDAQYIKDAVCYHDVGKLAVARDYHYSFYCTAPHKEKLYRSHVEKGVEVVRDELGVYLPAGKRGSFEWCIDRAISEHHEALNGEGFPNKKNSKAISIVGRITALADQFDNLLFVGAMGRFDFDSAISELEGMAGTVLDKRLVKIFLADREALYSYTKSIFDSMESKPSPDTFGIKLKYSPVRNSEKKKIEYYRVEKNVNDVYYGAMKADILIPVAESLGHTQRFEKLAFQKLCEEMDLLWTPDLSVPNFVFPLSAKHFESRDFYDYVINITDTYEIEREKICFSLCESEMAIESLEWKPLIEKYRSAGFSFMIEDFGSNASMLSALDEISVDRVCFKDHYLEKISANTKTKALVIGLIKTLTSMDIKPVICSAKTQSEVDFLSAIGVQLVAGEVWGEAIDASSIECLPKGGN